MSIAVLTWTLSLLPFQVLAWCFGGRTSGWIPRLYHMGATRLLRLKVVRRGQICRKRPVLYTANHASWLDIIALGSVLNAGFIAKSEVAKWPGFGLLAKLQGSIFVDRSRQKTALETTRVAKLLAQGHRLVLFPEGTSNDGVSILPFRSSYFAVAENVAALRKGLMIQPVSITYRTRNGLPLVRSRMPALAWYGDMDLLPHLWHLFCEGGEIEVILQFHKPVDSSNDGLIDGLIDSGNFQSRKAMAKHCHDVVCDGMEHARSRNQLKQGS